jgi:threonine dehydratase
MSHSVQSISIDDIRRAALVISEAVTRTPCTRSQTLSQLTGAEISLKLENQQFTASFKDRGALNRLMALSDAEKVSGVIAMSAGNHAQAIAYHATRLGIPATIVMPENTSFIKITNTERLGATIVLHGDTLEEAGRHAQELREKHSLTFIHPYDDPLVIAGQGTAALEILEDMPEIDILVIPIGGGGLIAGCSIAAKAIKPDIEIIGVHAAMYPAMKQALGGDATAITGTTIADGIAVKSPGVITQQIIAELVDHIILVEENRIEHAVYLLAEIEKLVVEGAGAAALAAILQDQKRFSGHNVGILVSGGNIDSRTLANVLMRGMIGAGRVVRLRIELSDLPGTLSTVSALIGALGGNIIDVDHNRWFRDIPARTTVIDVLIETRRSADSAKIIQGIEKAGFKVRRLSQDAVED